MSPPRYYVESLSSISADPQSGIVKLTLATEENGKDEPVVQLVVSAARLPDIMHNIDDTMRKKMGGPGGPPPPGPGGPRGPGGFRQPGTRKGGPGGKGKKGGPLPGFKDLTKD